MVDGTIQDSDDAGPGFWSDLRASTVACLRTPDLLVMAAGASAVPVTLQMAAAASGKTPLLWLGVLLGLALTGFGGAKRVWLARLFDGQTLAVSEAFDLTFHYFGRFFALTFLTGLASVPIFALVDIAYVQAARNGDPAPTWTQWILLAGILVVDVAYTFVTPELTFQQTSATRSIGSGIGLLVRSLPRSWPYLLTPGLVVLASGRLLSGALGSVWIVALWTAAAAVVSLIFAGAILRFYLRLRPRPSDTPQAPDPVVLTRPEAALHEAKRSEVPATNAAGEWNIEAFRAAGWTEEQLRALGWFESTGDAVAPQGNDSPEDAPTTDH